MDPQINNRPTPVSPSQTPIPPSGQLPVKQSEGWFSWTSSLITGTAKTLGKVVYSKTEEKKRAY